MKIILTSDGITSNKIKKEILKHLSNPENTKVLVVHSVLKKRDLLFLIGIRKQLLSLGIKRKNIDYVNISNNLKIKKEKYDLIYLCGGNTFYILDRLRKTKLDKYIIKQVKEGALYLGASAGSILASKTIEIAGWGSEPDDNFINLKDLRSFNFIDIEIYPHFNKNLLKEVNEFKNKRRNKVIPIKDKQAVVIINKNIKIIR